ncbi:MAG: HipA domain-containing protein [Synergistaceae bacterium]|nr:HipA domain-containing protein [Synergistaceae bacterium]
MGFDIPFCRPHYTSLITCRQLKQNPLSEPRVSAKPSFSGYQDKFTAHLTVEGGKLFLSPVDQETERGNVIVKPAHLKYPFIAENEYICMELARHAGLPTPRVFLFQQPNLSLPRQHLAVERFDVKVIDGQAQMLNITEFAPLMGLVSAQKYEPTTEALFTQAQQNLPVNDMKAFAKAYFLGSIVRNGDMHAKNFSVAVESDVMRLTPIYDMVNTEVYGISTGGFRGASEAQGRAGSAPLSLNVYLALKLANSYFPKMADIVKFLLNYLPMEDMEETAQAVRKNLSACANRAFAEAASPNMQKFRKRLEQSVSGGATQMLKAISRIKAESDPKTHIRRQKM